MMGAKVIAVIFVVIASAYSNNVVDVPLFGNSANKHLDRMADIPGYVNLNEGLDRSNFLNGTCTVWNQYIPYCSFCTANV